MIASLFVQRLNLKLFVIQSHKRRHSKLVKLAVASLMTAALLAGVRFPISSLQDAICEGQTTLVVNQIRVPVPSSLVSPHEVRQFPLAHPANSQPTTRGKLGIREIFAFGEATKLTKPSHADRATTDPTMSPSFLAVLNGVSKNASRPTGANASTPEDSRVTAIPRKDESILACFGKPRLPTTLPWQKR